MTSKQQASNVQANMAEVNLTDTVAIRNVKTLDLCSLIFNLIIGDPESTEHIQKSMPDQCTKLSMSFRQNRTSILNSIVADDEETLWRL